MAGETILLESCLLIVLDVVQVCFDTGRGIQIALKLALSPQLLLLLRFVVMRGSQLTDKGYICTADIRAWPVVGNVGKRRDSGSRVGANEIYYKKRFSRLL